MTDMGKTDCEVQLRESQYHRVDLSAETSSCVPAVQCTLSNPCPRLQYFYTTSIQDWFAVAYTSIACLIPDNITVLCILFLISICQHTKHFVVYISNQSVVDLWLSRLCQSVSHLGSWQAKYFLRARVDVHLVMSMCVV